MKKVILLGCVAAFYVHTTSTLADEAFAMRSDTTVVTIEDVERYMEENVPKDEARRSRLLAKPGFFHELAESLVTIRSLSEEALASGLIDERQMQWEARHIYQRALVAKYREAYLADAFRDTDWDKLAEETYLAEPEQFREEDQVSAAHILVKTDIRSDEEAQDIIKTILQRISAGDGFSELALEFSEDPTVQVNKGSLGFFPKRTMDPAFATAAFALTEVGEVSEPVKSKFGYHLIRLEGKKPGEVVSFSAAKKRIISNLQKQWSNKLWQEKVTAIRSDESIVLNEEAFEHLKAVHGSSRRATP